MGIRKLDYNNPATVVVGKHQFAYLYQGYGQRPLRIDLTDATVASSGIDAPDTEPGITRHPVMQYYVARADVVSSGAQYTVPPVIVFSGASQRPATAMSFLSGDGIQSVMVTDGGRGYTSPPGISLQGTSGSGAVLEAVLDTGASELAGAIATHKIIRNADAVPCLPYVNYDGVPVDGSGNPIANWSYTDVKGNTWRVVNKRGSSITFEVTLYTSFGSAPMTQSRNAVVELTFGSTAFSGGFSAYYITNIGDAGVRITDPGVGYDKTRPFVLELPGAPRGANGIPDLTRCGASGTQPLILEFYTADNPNSPTNLYSGDGTYPIKEVRVVNGGSGYTGRPALAVSTINGQGAILQAEVTEGKISSVAVVAGGRYTAPPSISPVTGGGSVAPISRAHLRGVYQCCYRWVDDTPEERGGPICSSISPINEFDAGDGAGGIVWDVPTPPVVEGRTLTLELWRSTSNQAYTLYRLPADALTLDDYTDAELSNPNRDNYLAMPILLPNGELNAGRFGVPPSDKAVACMFQDRLWLAGDTSGTAPNTLLYSEVDEPESIPDVNELVLQTNVKAHDAITALIPYGGSLGVMQAHHAYRLSYVAQPLIDANLQLAAFRGCLNQRCWDEHQGVIYAMDTDGVYALDQGGAVKVISDAIADKFMRQIDFSSPRWFSVVADKNLDILRVSVRMVGDEPGEYPTRQLCYSFTYGGWWEERYPHPLVGGCNIEDTTGYYRCVYGGAEGDVYGISYRDSDAAYKTISKITVTDPGTGYVVPPKITVTGGAGAVIDSSVAQDGSLLGIYVRCGGYGYENPVVVIEPPPEGRTATAVCEVMSGPVDIPCWHKSGNFEYPSDSMAQGGKVDSTRSVGVLYAPTNGPSDLKLRMYYNNKPYARTNVVRRERGDGAIYSDTEPAVLIDMDAGLAPEELSSGVCRAMFSGATMDDFRGNDRHVAVEIQANGSAAGPATIHHLDVYGVPGDKGE